MFSLEVHVMDQCNLNCKGCTHFCPLVDKNTKPKDLNQIILDIIRLNSIHVIPTEFKILGGEPLMHPELEYYLEAFRGVLPYSKVYIWTNGLLLPKMPESFFEKCQFYDIGIKITPYKPSRENPRIQEVVNKYKFVEFDGWFMDEFWASPISITRPGNSVVNYNKCRIKTGRCNILENGRIYQCAIPAFAHYLNDSLAKGGSSLKMEVTESDYVDIYQVWNERDLMEKLYQPTPVCRYCTAECGKNLPWSQSLKDPSEWLDQDLK